MLEAIGEEVNQFADTRLVQELSALAGATKYGSGTQSMQQLVRAEMAVEKALDDDDEFDLEFLGKVKFFLKFVKI